MFFTMNTPLISIIIPVYQAERYLHRCMESVLAQTYPNWECILIDDGSLDNSGKICQDYSAKDTRIHIIHQNNAGASSARNAGIESSQGDFLCFIDADDYVTPDYISSMYNEMESNVDLIFQGITHLQGEKTTLLGFKEKKIYSVDSSCKFFDEYSLFRFCGSYCKLFRRTIIEQNHIRYSKNIICAEDYDFLLRYLIHCENFKVLPCYNYIYISYGGSVSTRIYSFDKEYSGLCQITKSMASFALKVPTVSLVVQQRFLVTYYTQRVLFSNYRNDYSRHCRLLNFKTIDKPYLEYFGKYHKPETPFLGLVKLLYSNRCFILLDILMKIAVR